MLDNKRKKLEVIVYSFVYLRVRTFECLWVN